MPIGSQPGERRGGRQKGTPNKATQLRANAALQANAAFASAVDTRTGQVDADKLREVLVNMETGALDTTKEARERTQLERFDGDAHALLQSVYRDPRKPLGMRIDCAKTAIAYERPRLQAIAQVTETSTEAQMRAKDGRTALHDAVAMLLSVPGTTVTHLAVTSDQHVHAGDVLDQLDDAGTSGASGG